MRVTASCNQRQEKMASSSYLEIHIVSSVLKVTMKVHLFTAGKVKCSTYTWPLGVYLNFGSKLSRACYCSKSIIFLYIIQQWNCSSITALSLRFFAQVFVHAYIWPHSQHFWIMYSHKDLAMPHSQVSIKYFQKVIIMFCPITTKMAGPPLYALFPFLYYSMR